MLSLRSCLSLLILTAFAAVASGQGKSIDDLNREKARLLSLIEQNNKMMEEYSNRRNSEMMRIAVVDGKIAKRMELIGLYTAEVDAYNEQIRLLNGQIDSVADAMKRQKNEYAELLRRIQARGNGYSPLAYILSSQSFNQSYRRFLFLRQYSSYRRSQFEQLNATKQNFSALKNSVNQKLTSINIALAKINDENSKLRNERLARKRNVDSIVKSQGDIQQNIKNAEQQAQKVEEMIEAAIREEAERARREAEEAERRKRQGAKKAASAPADIMDCKGKLPWPVRSCVVTSAFGEHDHPLVPQIKISNNGIDMDILGSTEVHPVYKGRVSRIIVIPGSCASIIVRHGQILTVYSNLAEVFVKKDQEVDVKTNLGKVYSGDGVNSNMLHFEIWQGQNKQNPELWLKKQ